VRILVGLKHVPDTESKIRPSAERAGIDESQLTKWIISPYDEYALEAALRLREAGTASEVVVVTVGRAAAQASLRQGLAMGADRALLVQDERFERADALTRARALAAVARQEEARLVLLGRYGVGTDEGQTGPMLAEVLGWPHAASISTLEIAGDTFHVERAVEGAVEVQAGRVPAVLTCDKGLNEPRYPTLKGIMQAKKKPLDVRSASDVGANEAELAAGPRVVWEGLELPPPRQRGRILGGGPEEAARELARLLRDEAKVI
jgi:electron transfer flavoprotein beta subunit